MSTENRSNGGPAVYDKNRREIRRGDILKVFHFTGPRRRRFFMYKQAMGMVMLGTKDPSPYMFLDHLDLKGDGYHEPMDGRVLSEAEIVQGCEAFWETKRPLATRSSSKEADHG